MRFRGKSIRRKIVALLLVPLISLTAIWAFATVVTGRDAITLLNVSDVIDKVGQPDEDAVQAIQKERRESLILLADPRQQDTVPALHAAQRKTDQVLDKLRDAADDGDVRGEMNSDSKEQLQAVIKKANGLDGLRRKIEDHSISSTAAYNEYNSLVDDCYNFRSALQSVPDANLDKQSRAIVAMIRARDSLSREEALFAAAHATGHMTEPTLIEISNLIAERTLLYDINLPVLPASDQKTFADYRKNSAAPGALRLVETKLLKSPPSQTFHVLSLSQYEQPTQAVLKDYDRLGNAATDRLKQRIHPVATTILVRAGVAGILGLVAVIVSVIVSVRIGRSLVKELTRLRTESQEISNERLPNVMRRLAAGENVNLEAEVPRLEYGEDEMGQVGEAINSLQRAAIEAAVRQSELRTGISEVFVNLARRSQVLLHRQLTLLDSMERRTEDTDELADLFRLDHMTTRMRRHAEGLVILSGAAPSRQWRKPIRLMDVVRAAVAEVEDYERIEVRRLPRLSVTGPAVADITHLIAELLENATVFSPPHTAVQVHGERAAKGFTLEVHDRGLGMTPEALEEANERLAETPEFELSDTDRLGLFVVSRLAQRQGIRVSLQPSPYGGTTAVILIPSTLLVEPDEQSDEDSTGASSTESRVPGGNNEEVTAVFADRAARNSSLLDRSASIEAGMGSFGQQDQEADDEEGGIFRSRGLPSKSRSSRPVRPVSPAEQHQQAPEGPHPGRGGGPSPLPRRVSPVLVSDHGRPVEGGSTGRHARPPSPSPSWAQQNRNTQQPGEGAATPSSAYRTSEQAPGPQRSSNAGGWSPEPTPSPAPERSMPNQRAASGLPKRVRQASLAPQLKKDPTPQTDADRYSAESDPERDAEQARATMSSLQRGWQRGRRQNTSGYGGGPADTAPGTTYEGDGR